MDRFAWVIAGAAISVVAAAVPPAGSAPGESVLAPLGAELFRQSCASCHGTSGEGDGPVAAALKKAPADLTRIAARRNGSFPEAEISGWIDGRFDTAAHGTREMPVWGRLLQDPVPSSTDPDEVVRGRLLVLIEYLKTIQRP